MEVEALSQNPGAGLGLSAPEVLRPAWGMRCSGLDLSPTPRFLHNKRPSGGKKALLRTGLDDWGYVLQKSIAWMQALLRRGGGCTTVLGFWEKNCSMGRVALCLCQAYLSILLFEEQAKLRSGSQRRCVSAWQHDQ